MAIAVHTPAALPAAPRDYRVWVDATQPTPALAHVLDASYTVLAPSWTLRRALEQGHETARAFAVYYELELDAIETGVFDTLCRRARAHGLTLVSLDPSVTIVLRQYLYDWMACKADMRNHLYRRALANAAVAGSAYKRAWRAGGSRHRARRSARAAMRPYSEKPPNTT